jgi:hypothetical protein
MRIMLFRLSRAAALLGVLALPHHALGTDAMSDGQPLDIRRISTDQERQLTAGDTISYDLVERSESELGAGVAMYLPIPLPRVAEVLTAPDIVLRDSSITASGPIAPGAGLAALAGFKFAASETGEAEDVLDAAPGSRFNLAPAEIAAFDALRGTLRGADRKAVLEAVAAQWRMLLFQRWQAFRTRGLDGIAPYARRGGVSDPAALLRVAADDARIVGPFLPGLEEELLRYPAEQTPTTRSRFYWVKRQVQGRPTPILIHHLVDVTPELALYVERQVYVGHSYNASQILSAAVPFESGVLIFSSNRVSTDQVTGIGGGMKKVIGRRQLRAEIVRRFDRIRAALQPAPTPPERVESP